jgi:tight adherence protein B
MSRTARVAGGLLAALAALTAVGTAAGAVGIKRVDLGGYPFVRVTVLMSRESPAPTLLENGRPAPNLTQFRLHSKSVVLAVDRSRSMGDASLANAVAAARKFLANKPIADRIALFGVGSRALRLTQFATDTIDADSALRAMNTDGAQGRALYDTVALASLSLQSKPRPRVLILLTDGGDQGSAASLEDAIAAAKRVDVGVYVIGINGPQLTPGPLRTLADATGGTYYSADRAVTFITSAYARITAELRRTWILEYFTAKRPGDALRLTAKADRLGAATTSIKIPNSKAGSTGSGSWLGNLRTHWWGAALIGLIVGLFVLVGLRLAFGKSRKEWLRERLEPWSGEERAPRGLEETGRLAAFAPLFAGTERLLSRVVIWGKLERVLERAGVPLRAAELFYGMIGLGIVLALAAAISGSAAIVILVLFLVGLVAPYVVLQIKAVRRLRAFEAQLPAALNMLAGSLKAGHSFRQAVQTLVEEGGPPLDSEFRRVLTEARLGRSMEAALDDMGRRVSSKELDFVLRAVVIQRQVGGSLAGLLELVAETLTQRQQFKQKVRSLTASGRLSAGILIALPFFVAIMITLTSPGYLNPLFQTTTGLTLVFVELAMMTIGALVLRRIVSFKGQR